MKRSLILILFLFWLANLQATVISVSSSSDDINSPTAGMLRYCINHASSGDTITFSVDSVGLAGELKILYSSITIDGGDGVIIDGGQHGRVFNIGFGSSNTVAIKNLTLQNGYISDASYAWGGAMYVFGSGDGFSVTNCTFINNEANCASDGQGGALRTQGGTYSNCFFINNTLSGTGSSNSGGAVLSVGATFLNCVFAGNTAKYGGGVYATTASQFVNCTFTQNSAESAGNGAAIGAEGSSVFQNCIIYQNYSNNTLDNVDNNGATFEYSAFDAMDDEATGTNIGLSATPFTHQGNDSLSITENSVCVDAGYSYALVTKYDIIGNPRVSGNKVDMGAYEFCHPNVITGNVSFQQGTIMANTTISDHITTDANGQFKITSGENGVKIGDTLFFNLPPEGYEFYPHYVVVDQTKTIDVVAYKGIVVDEVSDNSTIIWNADTVNVFCNIELNANNLIINPNTKVKFWGYYGIHLSGLASITAKGTFNEPIIFTAADTSSHNLNCWDTAHAWNRVTFQNMNSQADTSSFSFCTFSYSKGIQTYGYAGGAMLIESFNNVKLDHCNFYHNLNLPKNGNSTNNGGGAIRITDSDITIVNCCFAKNLSTTNDSYNIWGGGGAIFVSDGTLTLINCVLVKNTAQQSYGGAIQAGDYGTVNIYNSIIRDNNDYNGPYSLNGATMAVYHSIVDDGLNVENYTKTNCFDADPRFTAPEQFDFSLQEDSPCINAGTTENLTELIPQTDMYGNNRVVQKLIDMGITEYQQEINLEIRGTLTKEYGDTLSGYNIFNDITTDSLGLFTFTVDGSEYHLGDTISFKANDGFEIYPSKLALNWYTLRNLQLIAYNGKVIDSFYTLTDEIIWNEDTINIFTDLTLKQNSLVIDKGTTVRFHGYYGITIQNNATLTVNGTIDDSVSFNYAYPQLSEPSTTKYSYCWKGLSFLAQANNNKKSIMEYCKIENVKHNDDGGAIYAYYYSRLEINHSLINNNRANNGGGLLLYESNIKLYNTIIANNKANNVGGYAYILGGGGLNLQYSNPVISGCIIANNQGHYYGGGMVLYYANPTIINSTIYSSLNSSETGQAMSLVESVPAIYNTIIYGNKALQIYVWDTDTKASRSIIKNSCIKTGNAFGSNNYINSFDKTPRFADVTNNMFTLSSTSPCINQGTTNIADSLLLAYDIHNELRVMGPTIEIGACEFGETMPIINAPEITYVNFPTQVSATTCYGSGSNWQWDFENDGTYDAQGETAEHTYTIAGTYTIKLNAYMVDSAVYREAYHSIVVYDVPKTGFYCSNTTVTLGSIIQFYDTSLNHPTEWLWDFGDNITSTLQNPQHEYTQIGRYTISLKTTNQAGSDSLTKVEYINITSTDITANFNLEVNIYPNPTEGTFTVIAPEGSIIEVFDHTGRLLKYDQTSSSSTCYDLSSYKAGMFFIRIIKDNTLVVRKLIKE